MVRLGRIQFMARHLWCPVIATSVIFRRIDCNAGINLNRPGYRRQMLIFFREEHMKRCAQYLSGLVFGLSQDMRWIRLESNWAANDGCSDVPNAQ